MKRLYLGGAACGKGRLASEYALQWQQQTAAEVWLLCTATADVAPIAARLGYQPLKHPASWQRLECGLALADALRRHSQPQRLLLIDNMALWCAQQLQQHATGWQGAKAELLVALQACTSPLLLISHEIGQGVVPLGAANRQFVDELGWLNQSLAQSCESVIQVIAGLPRILKEPE